MALSNHENHHYKPSTLHLKPYPNGGRGEGMKYLLDNKVEEIAKKYIRAVGSHWENEPAIHEDLLEDFAKDIQVAVFEWNTHLVEGKKVCVNCNRQNELDGTAWVYCKHIPQGNNFDETGETNEMVCFVPKKQTKDQVIQKLVEALEAVIWELEQWSLTEGDIESIEAISKGKSALARVRG
jgi:hypothetical protein